MRFAHRGYLLGPYDSHSKQQLFPYTLNQLILVMVMGCVFFAVRTGRLNIIKTSFGFKELIV
jgi:hypothetical protein